MVSDVRRKCRDAKPRFRVRGARSSRSDDPSPKRPGTPPSILSPGSVRGRSPVTQELGCSSLGIVPRLGGLPRPHARPVRMHLPGFQGYPKGMNRKGFADGRQEKRPRLLAALDLYTSQQPTRWWPGTESNRRHGDFQSPALPTELPGHIRAGNDNGLGAVGQAKPSAGVFCRVGRQGRAAGWASSIAACVPTDAIAGRRLNH